MASLESYIKWRGDILFEEREFNEIDNLVFCTLSYLDMNGSLSSKDFIPLIDLYARIVSDSGLNIKNADKALDRYKDFLFDASQSARFGNVVISDYVDMIDDAKNLQFSAMVFHIDRRTSYIVFRGTDETITGWKEDFMMSFSKTSAQETALKYTNAVMQKYKDNEFLIGGHSKGGNLALYTAENLSKENLDRIKHIYINDGPGLSEDVFGSINIEHIRSKTTKIIPEFCVIGKLFDTQFHHCKIVKSSASGIAQHDIGTWEVQDGELLLCRENTPESVWINQTFEQWLSGISIPERENIVNRLFDVLTLNGAVTIQDLSNDEKFDFAAVLRNFSGSKDKGFKRKIGSLPVTAFFDRILHKIKNGKAVDMIQNYPPVKAIALIVFGVLFFVLPENLIMVSVSIVLLVLLSINVFVTVRHLIRSRWNFRQNQPRVYFAIIFAVFYAVLIVKPNALFILSSGVFGTGFLCTTYNYIERIRSSDNRPDKIWYMIRSVLFALLGASILVVPSSSIILYSLAVGTVLVIDGIYRLVRYIRNR